VIARAQGTGTILADPPAISIADARVTEPKSGTKQASFTVSLNATSSFPVTVEYATADGTATAVETDFKPTSGTLTFNPGVTKLTVDVPVVGNKGIEADESFFVNLANATNGILVRSQAVGTIVDGNLGLTIADTSVTESAAGYALATFSIDLSAAVNFPVTVNYATANGTAVAASDYAAVSGTLTFAPNATTQTVTVPVFADGPDGGNESFALVLSQASNAVITRARAACTISDGAALPSLSIDNVAQGDGATTKSFVFTVTLSGPSGKSVRVHYATADGTATVPAGDYQATSGTLTFSPGQMSRTIRVAVNGDASSESDKTFTVNLSGATNATLVTSQGTGTIYGDDPLPLLTIGNVAAGDGSAGTKQFTFRVGLSAASKSSVTVDYATADGTATSAENDYQPASGTLTFKPGTTTQFVNVGVVGNKDIEADENFFVNLSNAANARLITSQGVGTILNDDLGLSVADVSEPQDTAAVNQAVFTVSLSAAATFPVSVNYATAAGSATGGVDYLPSAGTLTFAPGQTTQTVAVDVLPETINEANETFDLVLSNSANAIIARAKAVCTVVNSAPAPTLSIGNATMLEHDGVTTVFAFTVSLSAASGQTVSVAYATADGTATLADGDYTQAGGTLSFGPGQTSKLVTVVVNGDTLFELPESFYVDLSNAQNAALGTSQGVGTILNDDLS
jgi:hypothetical protein